MAVDLDDAAVDHGVFEVGVFSQSSEDTIEGVRFHPPAEALENRVPFLELSRQVAPRATGSDDPQHCFDEQPWIGARAPGVAFPTKAVRGDDRPLRVGQNQSDQGYLPIGILESLSRRFGNPQTSTGPNA